jgi:hypothetical protein
MMFVGLKQNSLVMIFRTVSLIWFFVLVLITGCGLPTWRGKAKAATAKIETAAGAKFEQTGDAAAPAVVSNTRRTIEIPVAPGSEIIVRAPTPALASDPLPSVTVTESAEVITGPASFSPPAPPTAREQANADAILRSYYFAGGLTLLAALLLWRGHGKAAGIAFLAAVAAPLLANFIGSEWGLRISIAGLCISGALFAAWHFMRDRQESTLQSQSHEKTTHQI